MSFTSTNNGGTQQTAAAAVKITPRRAAEWNRTLFIHSNDDRSNSYDRPTKRFFNWTWRRQPAKQKTFQFFHPFEPLLFKVNPFQKNKIKLCKNCQIKLPSNVKMSKSHQLQKTNICFLQRSLFYILFKTFNWTEEETGSNSNGISTAISTAPCLVCVFPSFPLSLPRSSSGAARAE